MSIVSHGQGAMIKDLLRDLENIRRSVSLEIILTINIPEVEELFGNGLHDVDRIIRNSEIKGFGENHNAAFTCARGEKFVVVNPDIRMQSVDLRHMGTPFEDPAVAACAPIVLSPSGHRENSFRKFPTIGRLIRKLIGGEPKPDYDLSPEPFSVDWAAGMFVVFRSSVFRELGGFDKGFFMYYEDADICRRLKIAGYKTVIQPLVSVVHDAQRDSTRKLRYLLWHVGSAIRFLSGP